MWHIYLYGFGRLTQTLTRKSEQKIWRLRMLTVGRSGWEVLDWSLILETNLERGGKHRMPLWFFPLRKKNMYTQMSIFPPTWTSQNHTITHKSNPNRILYVMKVWIWLFPTYPWDSDIVPLAQLHTRKRRKRDISDDKTNKDIPYSFFPPPCWGPYKRQYPLRG